MFKGGEGEDFSFLLLSLLTLFSTRDEGMQAVTRLPRCQKKKKKYRLVFGGIMQKFSYPSPYSLSTQA